MFANSNSVSICFSVLIYTPDLLICFPHSSDGGPPSKRPRLSSATPQPTAAGGWTLVTALRDHSPGLQALPWWDTQFLLFFTSLFFD